jgi:hypothetical protein
VIYSVRARTAASRRVVLRGITSVASAMALSGCASLASSGAHFDASAISTNPSLLVATTRKSVNGARMKPWFGPERASATSVARAKLAPPGEGRFSLASVGLDDWHLILNTPKFCIDIAQNDSTALYGRQNFGGPPRTSPHHALRQAPLHVRFGSWPCENSRSHRARRKISKRLRSEESNHTVPDRSMPCGRIVFSTFRRCMSFHTA